MIDLKAAARMGRWQWAVSLLLLSATMIMYMDRQTLASLGPRIRFQFDLSAEQYGQLEEVFSYTFAFGSLVWGVLADVIPVRYLYPFVLLAWSLVGLATGLSTGYESLYYCRAALGFFESGNWPCALVVTHAILTSVQRPLGNSILQSGASIGSIITPQIILMMVPAVAVGEAYKDDAWRPPFIVIGSVGFFWALAWFCVVKRNSIQRVVHTTGDASVVDVLPSPAATLGFDGVIKLLLQAIVDMALLLVRLLNNRRFWALVCMVVSINIAWQLTRAWLQMFLQTNRGYSEVFTLRFMSWYFISTDVGCLLAGFVALRFARRGMTAHSARLTTYGLCAAVGTLTIAASLLPSGWLMLALLLCVGAGLLGLFPCYYSFTQEIDGVNMGKVTGLLSFLGWMLTAPVHRFFGWLIDQWDAWDVGLACIGCVPLIGLIAMLFLWPNEPDHAPV